MICQFAYPEHPHAGDLYRYNDEIYCHTCLGDHLIDEAAFFEHVVVLNALR